MCSLPIPRLEIDRSFISGLQNNQEGETLIHTLVQLGKSLSIETFAEGIEQQQELTLLRDEDCDNGQGFLFARPLDVAATEAFLQEWAEERLPQTSAGWPASLAIASISSLARSNSASDSTGVPSNGRSRCSSTQFWEALYSSLTFTVTGRGMR